MEYKRLLGIVQCIVVLFKMFTDVKINIYKHLSKHYTAQAFNCRYQFTKGTSYLSFILYGDATKDSHSV